MWKTYRTVPKIKAPFNRPGIYRILTAPHVPEGINAATATNTAGQ